MFPYGGAKNTSTIMESKKKKVTGHARCARPFKHELAFFTLVALS